MPKSIASFQFKVTLLDTRPPIWRRLLIPADYSFWDLHVAIQDAMGWDDYHLHEFALKRGRREVRIGNVGEFDGFDDVVPGWSVALTTHFTRAKQKAIYNYDFGDDWQHEVLLEKRHPDVPLSTPQCVAGRRRCPPEDCGGAWGYTRLLEILADPSHPEHEEKAEWIDGDFDPGDFDHSAVVFRNPARRMRSMLG